MPEKGRRFWRGLGLLGAALLALELIALFLPLRGQSNSSGGPEVGETFGSPEMLAESLFTDFVLPFEIASILLLVALIGAVVLAKKEP
jgi:NADH-quinone oxidoreductase subunit J